MYQRDECIAQASICRQKAEPAHYDYWIDQAVVWLQRAIQARRGKAVAYDQTVCRGTARLYACPTGTRLSVASLNPCTGTSCPFRCRGFF
jgi:hypothetical protein